MTRVLGTIFVAVIVASTFGSDVSAQVRVYAMVDSETAIYPGQTFTYSIVIEGGAKPTRVDISPLESFNPQPVGDGTAFEQVGARTTVRYSVNYAITARGPGRMTLPSVEVEVDGRSYTTNPVEVTVSAPGTTDRMSLEFSVSPRTCYIGQPLVMTVRWVVTARVRNASFNVPVFRSGDFYVEDVAGSGGAAVQTEATIDGVPVTVAETRELVNGVEAAVIAFRKVLIPRRSGTITLAPVVVSTDMAVERVRSQSLWGGYQLRYERFSIESDPIELKVSALPETGRPSQFYGLVGRYGISASATPTDVSVGDPITLTIRIGGNPYLKPVQWPALEQVPGLAGRFKIPLDKASPMIADGEKVFTQTIRANSADVTQIPPIPLAYFDPATGKYVVAETEPIVLSVASSRVLTDADVEGMDFGIVNREVEAIKQGLSANYYGPDVLIDQRFSLAAAVVSPGYLVIWLIPFGGLLASVAYKLVTRSDPETAARKRCRRACKTAVDRLKSAEASDLKDKSSLIVEAVQGYLGDRFGRSAGSLTADDCRDLVADRVGDAELADRLRAKVTELEAVRYAPMQGQFDAARIREMIALINQIEEKSKR